MHAGPVQVLPRDTFAVPLNAFMNMPQPALIKGASPSIPDLEQIASQVRRDIVRMVHGCQSGHPGGSLGCTDFFTALYFSELQPCDRVAVKPHASPAFHAVQYLLGNLPRKYLTELRTLKGIQAYPSKSKDHDPIDFHLQLPRVHDHGPGLHHGRQTPRSGFQVLLRLVDQHCKGAAGCRQDQNGCQPTDDAADQRCPFRARTFQVCHS